MRAENENIIKNMMKERVRVEKQVHELEKRNKALAEAEANKSRTPHVKLRLNLDGGEAAGGAPVAPDAPNVQLGQPQPSLLGDLSYDPVLCAFADPEEAAHHSQPSAVAGAAAAWSAVWPPPGL